MKKIAKFMYVAAIAAFAVLACSKPTTKPDPQPDPEPDPEPTEEVKLAIDGKFDEWEDVAEVAGADAIIVSKTQSTDKKIYFYLEVAVDEMNTEKVAFANYLNLYLDCGEGTDTIGYWGEEADPASFDICVQIWLMQNGRADIVNWSPGFTGKAKIIDGKYKAEFSLDRSNSGYVDDPDKGNYAAYASLSSKMIYYGMYLTDQSVGYDEAGVEVWEGGECIGSSPYADEGEEMAKVNAPK